MPPDDELARFIKRWPLAPLADSQRLEAAAEHLRINWPPDYVALITEHNGAGGFVGDNEVMMIAAEDLVVTNDPFAFETDFVVIGSNGTGSSIAYDRNTLDVLLLDEIAPEESAIVLGGSLAEAFAHFERDDVFDAPKHRPHVSRANRLPDDRRDRVLQILHPPADPLPLPEELPKVVTFEEARAKAQSRIDEMLRQDTYGLDLILVDGSTMTEPYGWVFFYTDRRWLETQDIRYGIAGNGPMLVLRQTGDIRVLGTGHATDYYLAPYRAAHLAGLDVSDVETPR